MKFLLHLVADLHQPLHSADDEDRGGNAKQVEAPGMRLRNLHAYWDTGAVRQLGDDFRQVAAGLVSRITPRERSAWASGTPLEWTMEAFRIAKEDVYGRLPLPDQRGVYVLPRSYLDMSAMDAARQLARAGVRLAAILNSSLCVPGSAR